MKLRLLVDHRHYPEGLDYSFIGMSVIYSFTEIVVCNLLLTVPRRYFCSGSLFCLFF